MLTSLRLLLLLLCGCQLTAWSQQPAISNDSWRSWISLSTQYGLRDDGLYCWYQYGAPATGDTLIYRSTGNSTYHAFPRGFNPNFSGRRFLCQLPGDSLIIINADSVSYLSGIQYYLLQDDQLVLKKADTLCWTDLENGHTRTVWQGEVLQMAFNGRQLVFTAGYNLRCYQQNSDSTVLLHSNCIGGIQFSKDGKYLLFQLSTADAPVHNKLRIWHYQDYYLQTPPAALITMVLAMDTKKCFPVNTPGTQIAWWDGGRYIITQNSLNHQEYYWNKTIISSLYLIDIHTGVQKMITANSDKLLLQPAVSPNGQFMTWLDPSTGYIRCHEIASGQTRNLLKGIGVAQWSSGDSSVFIETNHDVWQVDPLGNESPVNLTHGRPQRLNFRLLFPGILTAFNTHTKANSFWKWVQGQLTNYHIADCLYYFPVYPLDAYKPVKAKDTGIYLLATMQAGSSPNLLLTANFKTFTGLTHIHPEQNYNWLNVTLTRHGLLYKPQDFNPKKKYPVIFHYYEGSRDSLHRYLKPALSEGTLNIPWYVSNGYIVFVPHIQTKQRHPGRSAAGAVIKAAKYLSAFSWVDKEKMGLQGHSFGGYVTHYVITHSRLFAAAQASAGPVDFISGYGAIRKLTGTAMQPLYEQGQNKMGVPPWEKPLLYLKNSPVIRADKVHTPLLLMHNDNDNAVPFAQSMELFTALRRLQKRVWLLQYSGEGHQLFRDEDRLDFTIRQQQFFDHYLKGLPMPDWMKVH